MRTRSLFVRMTPLEGSLNGNRLNTIPFPSFLQKVYNQTMTYNVHPIIVHFPIALLFLYSIIKILPLEKWLPSVAWAHIKRLLLVFGVLGAFAALATGEVAEHLVHPNHDLVEAHSSFATASTIIYGLLLLGELLTLFMSWITSKINSSNTLKYIVLVQKILTRNLLSKVLALLGLSCITLTGMLGGVMVYGLSADPMAKTVLQILGINY
jgi:uncharacterized membrane protein